MNARRAWLAIRWVALVALPVLAVGVFAYCVVSAARAA